MAGYDHQSGMSNNAVDAYRLQTYPLSQITKADLKKAGIDCSLSLFRYLEEEGHIDSSEYHHSSKFFNKTDFYDLTLIREWFDERIEFDDFEPYRLAHEASKVVKKTAAFSRGALKNCIRFSQPPSNPKETDR